MKRIYMIMSSMILQFSCIGAMHLHDHAVAVEKIQKNSTENDSEECVIDLYQSDEAPVPKLDLASIDPKDEIHELAYTALVARFGEKHTLKKHLLPYIKKHVKRLDESEIVEHKNSIDALRTMSGSRRKSTKNPEKINNSNTPSSNSSDGDLPPVINEVISKSIEECIKSEVFQKWLARILAGVGTLAGSGATALITYWTTCQK